MVFFTCNHCGSSLKKNKVEKHYASECRNSPSVSCMDCMKDFHGSDYEKHTKCITEDQKYSGKPVDPNSSMGKGEKKQLEWVETVRQILENKGSTLTQQERQLFEAMKDFENIPRKKKKFENFLKNVVRRQVNQQTIDNVWAILEAHKPVPQSKTQEVNGKHDSADKTQEQSCKEEKSSKKVAKEEVVAENGVDDKGGEDSEPSKKSKKKKKKGRSEEGVVPTEEAVATPTEEEVVAPAEEEVVPEETKTKKKKKQRKSEGEVEAAEEKAAEEAVAESTEKETKEEEKVEKLSKKERKEKKKREKYEAELKSVADDKNVVVEDMDIDLNEAAEDGVKGDKSKKKKNKKGEKVESAVSEEVVPETKKTGKKGKRKLEAEADADVREEKRIKSGGGHQEVEENGCEANGEGVNGSSGDVEDKPKGKFKWDKTIVSVLQAAAEHELPVKRLRKKVLAEYQLSVESGNTRGQSLEEAMAMFERKLHKVPGIKVMKDRAKLIVESE